MTTSRSFTIAHFIFGHISNKRSWGISFGSFEQSTASYSLSRSLFFIGYLSGAPLEIDLFWFHIKQDKEHYAAVMKRVNAYQTYKAQQKETS